MRARRCLPWKSGSSSACHPTDSLPSLYKFKLQQLGHSLSSLMPHFGVTTRMASGIHCGKTCGATVTPPYLYGHVQPGWTIHAVCRGMLPGVDQSVPLCAASYATSVQLLGHRGEQNVKWQSLASSAISGCHVPSLLNRISASRAAACMVPARRSCTWWSVRWARWVARGRASG